MHICLNMLVLNWFFGLLKLTFLEMLRASFRIGAEQQLLNEKSVVNFARISRIVVLVDSIDVLE